MNFIMQDTVISICAMKHINCGLVRFSKKLHFLKVKTVKNHPAKFNLTRPV